MPSLSPIPFTSVASEKQIREISVFLEVLEKVPIVSSSNIDFGLTLQEKGSIMEELKV